MARLKFTIHGYQQSKLIEFSLTNDDALIMSVIRDMYSSSNIKSKTIDGERYIWVNQTILSEYVPIIGSLRTIQRTFKKLVDKKIFKSKVFNSQDGRTGKYFYLAPTSILDDLSEYVEDIPIQSSDKTLNDQATNCHMIKRQNDVRSSDKLSYDQATNCHNKDTSTNNTSTNNTKDINGSNDPLSQGDGKAEEAKNINRVQQEWNKIIAEHNLPLKELKALHSGLKRYGMVKARISQYGIDGVIDAINLIPKSPFLVGSVSEFIITFDWFIRPNNFLKVYEGNYVNGNKGGNFFNETHQRYNNQPTKMSATVRNQRKNIERRLSYGEIDYGDEPF